MVGDKYQCAICGDVFYKKLTEDQEISQLEDEFGDGWLPEDCDIVCDDCFQKHFGPISNE